MSATCAFEAVKGAVCPPSRTWSGTPPEDIFDPKKLVVSEGGAVL